MQGVRMLTRDVRHRSSRIWRPGVYVEAGSSDPATMRGRVQRERSPGSGRSGRTHRRLAGCRREERRLVEKLAEPIRGAEVAPSTGRDSHDRQRACRSLQDVPRQVDGWEVLVELPDGEFRPRRDGASAERLKDIRQRLLEDVQHRLDASDEDEAVDQSAPFDHPPEGLRRGLLRELVDARDSIAGCGEDPAVARLDVGRADPEDHRGTAVVA